MIRTCVLVKRIPIYIDISGGVGTKVAWKLLPGRERKRNGDYLGEWAPQWRGSHCQEERAREMEMQWGVVGSPYPWRKARTLSLQTCSDLYQILRGSSIRRDEHHCGVGFRIQWLDFRILVGWFIPRKFSEKNLWMLLNTGSTYHCDGWLRFYMDDYSFNLSVNMWIFGLILVGIMFE